MLCALFIFVWYVMATEAFPTEDALADRRWRFSTAVSHQLQGTLAELDFQGPQQESASALTDPGCACRKKASIASLLDMSLGRIGESQQTNDTTCSACAVSAPRLERQLQQAQYQQLCRKKSSLSFSDWLSCWILQRATDALGLANLGRWPSSKCFSSSPCAVSRCPSRSN